MEKETKLVLIGMYEKLLIRKPSLLQFPGKDLPQVTTGSSLLNNNSHSNEKRYQISFSWYVRKIIDKKAQANKCPSLLQFPGKDLPKATTAAHMHFSIIIYSHMEKDIN